MGTVNVVLGEDTRLNLILGQQLENAVTEVVFDFSAWKTTYGSGTLALSVQRPGDDQPYAVALTTSGTNATWGVTNLDTAYKGVGHIQLTYTVGTAIKKSVVYKFTVYESLGANGEYPSPGQTWQQNIEAEIGTLSNLPTTDKSSLVASINEIDGDITDVKSDLNVVDSLLYSENVVINNSNSDTYTSDSTVRFANLYDFVVGRSYRLEVTVNSVSFQAGASTAISSDMSKSTGTALTNLGQVLLRVNNTLANPIQNGDVFVKEFTALAGEVNVLMRYKVTTGTLDITVKCYEITNITDDLNDLSNRIDENKNLIINSRMQMGAHRGAEYYAPPNCVGAYEIAGKMGFPWAWLAQIRWSAEKTLYVMHDEDVSITTNGTGNLSELSDSYIETLLCNKLSGYDYSKFTNDELKVPTLEKVIQICLRYGMKMCFRIEPFPNNMDTEDNALIWNNFINLIKAYNITHAEASYSAYNSLSMILCLDLLGDVEICPYEGSTFTAQNYVDWFDERSEYFGTAKKAVLIPASSLTLNDVKLLHTNDIRVYAFTNSNTPTDEVMENLATWGVDILQNPKFSRIPISD